jgi:hypothetical protein
VLAGEHAGRQRQRTMNRASSSLSPARGRHGGSCGSKEAMDWHRWLATLLVMLALTACAQGGLSPLRALFAQ